VQAQGPVAHQILETWTYPRAISVDVATGKERPVRTTLEVWYDSRGNASRFVDSADGRIQTDHAQVCPHSVARGPCWPGFSVESYWPLDTSRYTSELGTFHGRRVIWLAPRQPGGFAASPGDGERIGLDPRTHEPVADRTHFEGKIISEAQVLERKPDIAAGEYAFVVPNPSHQLLQDPPAFSAVGADPLALRARRALGRTPLWLGERFQGHRLRTATIGSTFNPPTGIRPDAAPLVTYDYGNVGITEFASPTLYGPTGGPLPGRVTLLKSATNGSTSPPIVDVRLARDGVFVIAGRTHPGSYALDRAGALRIAGALQPVPLP
jgi:hypothetical protein